MWDAAAPMTQPLSTGLINRMVQRPLICIQANGSGTGVSLYGHSAAVVVDGTPSQVKDSTGQYLDYDADANRNGWRQQSEVDPQTGVSYVWRGKSPAALPVAAGIGRWVCGLVVDNFENANPSAVQGIAFRFDRTVGDTNWQAVCRGPAGENSQDTGVAFTTNTRFDMGILMCTGVLTFILNDQRVARFTADLPTALLNTYAVTRSNGASADVRIRNAFTAVQFGLNT